MNGVAIRKMNRIGIQNRLVLEVDRDRHNGQQTINIFFSLSIHWSILIDLKRLRAIFYNQY